MKSLLKYLKQTCHESISTRDKSGKKWVVRLLQDLAITLPVASILCLPQAVEAGGIARNLTSRFSIDQNGSIRIIGNSTMTCADDASGQLADVFFDSSGNGRIRRFFNNPYCASARNASASSTNNENINDNNYMVYVDVDGDGSTFSSSTADFTLPADAKITKAYLYWSGSTEVVDYKYTGNRQSNGDYIYVTPGQAAPNVNARNQVLLKVGSGAYQNLTASQFDTDADGAAAGDGNIYQGFVDVTDIVKNQASGTTQTYTVGNIQSAQGARGYGSWSLVVVYENPNDPLRNLNVYDGFIRQQNGDPNQTTNFSGFITPNTGAIRAEAGIVVYEGDTDLTGDQFLFNGTQVSDALNPATDFWNSNLTQFGTSITARNPNRVNLFGTDINLIDVSSSINNGDNSASLTFTTEGDQYYIGAVTFVIDIFKPDLTRSFIKKALDINGADFEPNDEVEYEITYTNTGNDGAADVVLSDPIPAATTFVPGSIQIVADPDAANVGTKTDTPGDEQAEFDSANNRIVIRTGTGANATQGGLVDIGETVKVKFRVQINPNFAAPDSFSNQATINYTSQTTGTSYNGVSDDPDTPEENDATQVNVSEPTATNPDVVLVKRITAINGDRTKNPNDNTPLNTFVDDTDSTRKEDDNSPNWPDNYLIGAINAGKVKPGDEIEYTVYFLNAGNSDADNLRICDRITPNQDFKLNAYGNEGENNDLQLKLDTKSEINLTSANDSGDRAQLIPAGTAVDAKCNLKGTNDNGTLEIDITGTGSTSQSDLTTVPGSTGKGTPDNSYGSIRFTTTVTE
jgi:uncharacterized repeat protein (TIGR01451 family)